MLFAVFKKHDPAQSSDAELVADMKRFAKAKKIGFWMTFIPMLAVPLPMSLFLCILPVAWVGMAAALKAQNKFNACEKEAKARNIVIEAPDAPAEPWHDLSPTFNPEAAITLDNTVKAMPRIKIKRQPETVA